MKELIDKRTRHSKLFSISGQRKRLLVSPSPVHVRGGAGEWVDAEPNIVNGKAVGVDYSAEIYEDRIGYRGVDPNGKPFELELDGQFSPPEIDGNKATYRDVALDMDFEIIFHVDKIMGFRVQKTSASPKSVEFRIYRHPDSVMSIRNLGADAVGQKTELTPSAGRPTTRVNEEVYTQRWTGRVRVIDKQTRKPSWSNKPDDVRYPVRIDPSFTATAGAAANDGRITSLGGITSSINYIVAGLTGYQYYYSLFPGITIPKSSTINSARVALPMLNTSGANYTIFARWAKLAAAANKSDASFAPTTGWTGTTAPRTDDPLLPAYSGGSKSVNVKAFVQAMVNANAFTNEGMLFEFALSPQTSPGAAGYVSFGGYPAGGVLTVDYTEPPPSDKTVVYFP